MSYAEIVSEGRTPMELRQLRTFLEVAETGSLSRAAGRLRIAQPALSRQIRMLEDELGAPLFARHARGMALSEAGEILVVHARAAMRELDRAKSDLAALAGQITGKVAIGLLPSVSDLMTGRFAAVARRRHQRLRLQFITGLATHLLEWLEKQEIDVAIVSEPVPANLEFTPLLEEPLYLVGSAAIARFRGRTLPLRELANYPLILPSSDLGLRGGIDRAVHAAGVELDVAVEANSLHVQRSLIRAGVGYALLPSSVILGRHASADVRAARIVDPPIRRRIGLAMPILRRRPLAARTVADLILDEIRRSFREGVWPGARLVA
jgi:DNA-binding transcriptional LysR family regulator